MTSTDAKPPGNEPKGPAREPAPEHERPNDAEQQLQDEREEQSFPGSDPPGVGGPGII